MILNNLRVKFHSIMESIENGGSFRGRDRFRGRGGRGRGGRPERNFKHGDTLLHRDDSKQRSEVPESVIPLASDRINDLTDQASFSQIKENILLLLREGMMRDGSGYLLGSEIPPRYR